MSDREEKRAQFEQPRQRGRFPLINVLVVALVVAGVGFWKYLEKDMAGEYPFVKASGGEVAIPIGQVSDGQVHFFSYASKDGVVDFFVLKSQDGVIRAAFDACDVCYEEHRGYRQEGAAVVCINCGQQFRSDLINEVKGGCNPAPLVRTIRDGNLIIAEADLLKGAWFFQRETI